MKQQIFQESNPRYLETFRMIRAILRDPNVDQLGRLFFKGVAQYMRESGYVTRRQYDRVKSQFDRSKTYNPIGVRTPLSTGLAKRRVSPSN